MTNQSSTLLGYIFQPVVDSSRRVVSYEALARCGRSGLNVYSGTANDIALVPFEEQAKLFIESTAFLLRNSAAASISFNIEPRHCTSTNVELLTDLCRFSGVPTSAIELELIETSATTLPEVAIDSAKNAGFGVVLDDFGAGYSDVAAVQGFPFDRIKFDRNFLLGTSQLGVEMLKALHPVIKRAGFRTTIEGVENTSMMNLVSSLVADSYQGWLFGRGHTAADIVQMHKKMRVVGQ